MLSGDWKVRNCEVLASVVIYPPCKCIFELFINDHAQRVSVVNLETFKIDHNCDPVVLANVGDHHKFIECSGVEFFSFSS